MLAILPALALQLEQPPLIIPGAQRPVVEAPHLWIPKPGILQPEALGILPFPTPMLMGGGSGAAADSDFASVKLLLGFNGADASTTFPNDATGGIPYTPGGVTFGTVGNTQVDTAQSVFGGASGLFDGASDYLLCTDSSFFTWAGATDRTIEGWIRLNANGDAYFISKRGSTGDGEYILGYNGTNHLTFTLDRSGASVLSLTGSTAMSLNQWYYYAVARSGTATKMFLGQAGGTANLEASGTQSNSPTNGGAGMTIGCAFWWGPGSRALNGWLDEVRLTETCRYTAAFPVPAAAFPRS